MSFDEEEMPQDNSVSFRSKLLMKLAIGAIKFSRWCQDGAIQIDGYRLFSPENQSPNQPADMVRAVEGESAFAIKLRRQVEVAAGDPSLREDMIRGYTLPRRTEAEQLELIRANGVATQGNQFVWTGPSYNGDNKPDDDDQGIS